MALAPLAVTDSGLEKMRWTIKDPLGIVSGTRFQNVTGQPSIGWGGKSITSSKDTIVLTLALSTGTQSQGDTHKIPPVVQTEWGADNVRGRMSERLDRSVSCSLPTLTLPSTALGTA